MKVIEILGIPYEVKIVDELAEKYDVYGKIYYDKQLIEIDSKVSDDKQKETILHECIHGISEATGLELEEQTVQILSRSLYSLLKTESNYFFLER